MFDTSILLHSTRWVSDDSSLVRYLEPLLSSFFLLFDSCFSYDTLISLLAAIQKTETAGLLSQNTLLGYSSCQISLFSFILLSHTPHFSLSSSASLISSLLAVALICFFFPLSSPCVALLLLPQTKREVAKEDEQMRWLKGSDGKERGRTKAHTEQEAVRGKR